MLFLKKIFGFFTKSKKNFVTLKWKFKSKNEKETVKDTAPASNGKHIEFLINDPSTPQLIKNIYPTGTEPRPPISVKGYKGAGFGRHTMEGQAANCHLTIINTISFFNSMSEGTTFKWPAVQVLAVIPRAGVDLNAFYNRKSLQFFYINNPLVGGTFYTCDSTDIVSHELGHAILDSYRPDMWSAMSLEVASFHEAFADFTSLMHIMLYDEAIIYAINETGGDLRKPNVMSNIAEDFGIALHKLHSSHFKSSKPLRSAINDFKYTDPSQLPKTVSDDSLLAAECHNFGRIFLGALYDIFVMIYEDARSSGNSLIESVKIARNIVAKYLIKAVKNAPLNMRFYESMARTILWTDVVISNRKYHDRIQTIFCNRNLLSPRLKMLSGPKCENETGVMLVSNSKILKLSDVLIRIQTENPLYNAEIEVPQEEVYLYDSEKNLIDSIEITEEETLSGAQDMINYLHLTESVSSNGDKPFEIQDGKLKRNFII